MGTRWARSRVEGEGGGCERLGWKSDAELSGRGSGGATMGGGAAGGQEKKTKNLDHPSLIRTPNTVPAHNLTKLINTPSPHNSEMGIVDEVDRT